MTFEKLMKEFLRTVDCSKLNDSAIRNIIRVLLYISKHHLKIKSIRFEQPNTKDWPKEAFVSGYYNALCGYVEIFIYKKYIWTDDNYPLTFNICSLNLKYLKEFI